MSIRSGYKFGTTASRDREISPDPFRRRPTAHSPRCGASAVMDKRRRCGAERLLASPAGFVGGGGADLPDLSEDDVWPVFFSNAHSAAEIDNDDDRWPRTNLAGDRRWTGPHVGGLSLAFEEPYRGPTAPSLREKRIAVVASAPMDVPAWPRHLRAGSGGPPPDPEVEEEEEDAAGAEWLPPHEYLARAHGRSAATASVLEGAGRTLKGRDMSRVRDAVWSQTGFFG